MKQLELLMHFLSQVQMSKGVKETLQSAGDVSLSKAEEKIEVWQEDTWSFSGVIHHAEVLCEVH